jgi:ABC-type uncharacterized transport system ATPase subunit
VVIGPNGAGTTLLDLICGKTKTAGSIKFRNER